MSLCDEADDLLTTFGTTPLIQIGFSNEHFNQMENLKWRMFDFRLITLDHITFDHTP